MKLSNSNIKYFSRLCYFRFFFFYFSIVFWFKFLSFEQSFLYEMQSFFSWFFRKKKKQNFFVLVRFQVRRNKFIWVFEYNILRQLRNTLIDIQTSNDLWFSNVYLFRSFFLHFVFFHFESFNFSKNFSFSCVFCMNNLAYWKLLPFFFSFFVHTNAVLFFVNILFLLHSDWNCILLLIVLLT